MEMIIGFFVEVFFKRLIIRFLGVGTRYFFLNLLGKKVSLNDLNGKNNDIASQFAQDFYNACVGIGVLALLLFIIGYLFFRSG